MTNQVEEVRGVRVTSLEGCPAQKKAEKKTLRDFALPKVGKNRVQSLDSRLQLSWWLLWPSLRALIACRTCRVELPCSDCFISGDEISEARPCGHSSWLWMEIQEECNHCLMPIPALLSSQFWPWHDQIWSFLDLCLPLLAELFNFYLVT